MKKIINAIFIVVLCLCLCVSSLATNNTTIDSTSYVSIDTYLAALQEIGNEYGMEVELLTYDSTIQISQEDFEQALTAVRRMASSTATPSSDPVVPSSNNALAFIPSLSSEIAPATMSVTKNVYGHFLIQNVYGSADMRVDATVIVDMQNSYIIDVLSVDAYQLGSYVNFKSWTTTGIYPQTNSPSFGYLNLTVSGRAQFGYADPFTGIETGWTSNETHYVTIFCG